MRLLGKDNFTRDMLLSLMRCCAGEFLGTFVLLYSVCASSTMGVIGSALSSGLTLVVLVAGLAGVSGAHMNPAVTVGLTITGDCDIMRSILYIPTQIIGAISGALIYRASVGQTQFELSSGGINSMNETLTTPGQAFIGETVLMFSFLSVILLTKGLTLMSPVYVGTYVIAGIINNGGVSGGSMNPARSFGPSVVFAIFGSSKKAFANHWIYWFGPIFGATLAALLYKTLLGPEKERWQFLKRSFNPNDKENNITDDAKPNDKCLENGLPQYKEAVSDSQQQNSVVVVY